jgi:hypothetical protein
MRRRRRVVALAVIVGVATTAWMLWPKQRFRFLRGQTPVLNDDGSTAVGYRLKRDYTFPADFDEIRRCVDAELIPLGFEQTRDDRSMGPRSVRFERQTQNPQSGGLHDFVIMYQDMHYKPPQEGEPYSLVGYREAGWVSFQVHLERPFNRFERLLMKLRERTGF